MSILSEYAALIDDTITYLKDISSPLLVSKEEWQRPFVPQAKTESPAPLSKEVILPKKLPLKTSLPISSSQVQQQERVQEKSSVEPATQKKEQNRPKTDNAEIKPFLQRLSMALSDNIPDDAAATRMMSSYKEHVGPVDVILFACDHDAETMELIKNLSRSIDQKLAKIKVLRADRLEKEERWDLFFSKNPIKLFIATVGFTQLKKGMVHYKQSGDALFLHDTPLILLLPPGSYS